MPKFLFVDAPHERWRLIGVMALLAGVVFILHLFGAANGLYRPDIIGYDKIAHYAGGGFCGAVGLWLFHPLGSTRSERNALIATFLGALVMGIGWEIFEVLKEPSSMHVFLYWGDTIADIVADVLGGLSVGWVVHKTKR